MSLSFRRVNFSPLVSENSLSAIFKKIYFSSLFLMGWNWISIIRDFQSNKESKSARKFENIGIDDEVRVRKKNRMGKVQVILLRFS